MKISIITVVLNMASTIEKTLESVYNQTFTDYEYIIIDGGSTDGTKDLIMKWAPLFDTKMRIFFEKNDSGIYNAINHGISVAKGDIVGFIHADDHLKDNTIFQLVIDSMENKWVDLVYGNVDFVSNRNTNKIVRHYNSHRFTPDKLRYGFAPPHPSLYCKRKLYKLYGLYKEDYITAADFEMFARLFSHSKINYKFIPHTMVVMRQDGLSNKWRHRLSTNIFEKRRALRENHINVSIFALLRKYYYIFKS